MPILNTKVAPVYAEGVSLKLLMKIRIYILMVAMLVLLAGTGTQVQADSAASKEYQVKAAFLYNFIMFVEWPHGKITDGNEPLIIGIIGKDPFEGAFEPIKDKLINGRKVVIKRFEGLEKLRKSEAEMNRAIEEVRKSQLLFICRSEEKVIAQIVDLIKGANVLTIGDMPKFLESGGGIINFVMEEEKVRFEINGVAAEAAGLKIRSQLLRLAKRVIEAKK
ncbi:MAG: YfiR family protein [Phycisphaerae bacterium]|nr:YfiR family protein [Phycisphaerae bacterium]